MTTEVRTTNGTTTNGTLWNYRTDLVGGVDVIVGFDVEATDGHIGKVDHISTQLDRSAIVVDTGFWIFGKKRMIPAGMIERINYDDKKLFVRMTKHDAKEAPEFADAHSSPEFDRHDPYDDHYRPLLW